MDLEPFLRMFLAAALAVPIGLERELRGKAAGLRTHVVVGTASAALGYVSVLAAPAEVVGTDQTRIAAQVVSGVGFMGAGVIFASGGKVHGLTTAAALWGVSAIGLCVGLGYAPLALALMVVLVLFLWPVDYLNDLTIGQVAHKERTYQVVADDLAGVVGVQQVLQDIGVRAREFSLSEFGDGVSIQMTVRCREHQAGLILERARELPGIRFVSDEALAGSDG